MALLGPAAATRMGDGAPAGADVTLGDRIARVVLTHFRKSLPNNKGKPSPPDAEWTVLSAVVVEGPSAAATAVDGLPSQPLLRVAALGTGSKCLGDQEAGDRGDLVVDSHAEVVARKSFILYLMDQMVRVAKGQPAGGVDGGGGGSSRDPWSTGSIFEVGNAQDPGFRLKDGIRFHFYSSYPPCGDATITSKPSPPAERRPPDGCGPPDTKRARPSDDSRDVEDVKSQLLDEKREGDLQSEGTIRNRTDSAGPANPQDKSNGFQQRSVQGAAGSVGDVHRTGAKCLQGSALQDRKDPGAGYHTLGAFRTKPGRGYPSSSLSCSDKMLKWDLAGLQGPLLSCLLPGGPVRWSSITVGSDQFDPEALKRALFHRIDRRSLEDRHDAFAVLHDHPQIELPPELIRNHPGRSKVPSCCSIAHVSGGVLHQVIVDGRRQGTIKKHLGTRRARVSICPLETASKFMSLVGLIRCLKPFRLPQPVLELLDDGSSSSSPKILQRVVRYARLKDACKEASSWYSSAVAPFDASLPGESRKARRSRLDSFEVPLDFEDESLQIECDSKKDHLS